MEAVDSVGKLAQKHCIQSTTTQLSFFVGQLQRTRMHYAKYLVNHEPVSITLVIYDYNSTTKNSTRLAIQKIGIQVDQR